MPGRNSVRRRRASKLWTPQGGLFVPPSAFDDSAHGLAHEYYFLPQVAAEELAVEGTGSFLMYDSDGNLVADANEDEQNFSEIHAGRVYAGNIVTKNDTGVTDWYVDDNGDDQFNTGQSAVSAFATIKHAIEQIPKYNADNVIIHIAAASSHYENVVVDGFIGPGSLTFTGGNRGSTDIIGTIEVSGCSQEIQFDTLNISDDGYGSQQGTIQVNFSTHVQFVDIDVFTQNGVSGRGVSIYFNGSIGDAHGCYLAGTGGGTGTYVVAANQSVVRLGNNTGAAGGAGTSYSAQGSLIMMNGTRPQNATATSNGGLINGSATATTGAATGAANAINTLVIGADESQTYADGLGQGAGWGTDTRVSQGGQRRPVGNFELTGLYFYNETTIATTLSGKTVDWVEVFLARIPYGGDSGPVTLTMYTHDHATQPAGAPTIAGSGTDIGSLRWGEKKWLTLPTAVASGIRDGTNAGIAFNVGADFSRVASLRGKSDTASTPRSGTLRIAYH